MALIDANGYTLKSQNDYFDEEQQRYLNIDSEWNLDPSTPDGMKIASDAEIFANLDEALLAAYNSKNPDRATADDLEAIMALSGLTRQPGSGSTVTLTLSGTSGTLIPAGTLFKSTADASEWASNDDVTISGGTASVTATCTEVGATAAGVGEITQIVESISGLDSATNLAVATLGAPRETDALARLRRSGSVAKPSANQVDSIFANVADITGVTHLRIYENENDTPDANGLPAHSMSVVVAGGDDDEIAQAIYDVKSPGYKQHLVGTGVTRTVTSTVTGNAQLIRFSRPTAVPITVAVGITDDGSLPPSAEDLIADAIVSYSLGLIDGVSTAFNQTGYSIGEDVYVSQLYTPVNSVIGKYGNSYITSLTINTGSSVTIGFDELSSWSTGNITVTIS